MDWDENLTQWVWNNIISLEWQTWFYNYEEKIENCSIKYCKKSFKKTMYKQRK